MARRVRRRSTGGTRTATRAAAPQARSRARKSDNEGIIPVLARAVREVEARRRSAARCSRPARTKFQVVALLVREERARVKADTDAHRGPARRAAQAARRRSRTILAKTAARDTSLLALLAEDAVVSDGARDAQARDAAPPPGSRPRPRRRRRPSRVRPRRRRAPGRAAVGGRPPAGQPVPRPRLLRRRRSAGAARAGWPRWELLGPLFRSFEYAAGGAPSCMTLPEPASLQAPGGRELMPHQAQVVAAAAEGHRTFLLADEPGLGKTAQALLAAQAADAYPLLVVVPNVVKTNWAREAGLWTPNRTGHRDPRRRRRHRRLRRHRRRQLRGARPARRLARRPRLPRHGRRRGPLHQEQDLAALPARAAARRADPRPDRPPAADGADRHAR